MEALMNIRKFNSLKSVVLCKYHIRMASTAESKVDENLIAIADEEYEVTQLKKELEIERKRNKSRLNPSHQNLVHGRVPYTEPAAEAHLTFRYKRTLFGKYGKASNINPGTLWPTKSELQEMIEYEKVAHPFTFNELVEKQKRIKEEEEKKINERQQKILQNLQKLEGWKKDIAARAEKKLAELARAKAKRDALIEEVRKHFGYKLDPKDEKFKEMLIIKEREQKKKLKEEKSKAKTEKFVTDMLKTENK